MRKRGDKGEENARQEGKKNEHDNLTFTNIVVESSLDLREAPLDLPIACKIRHHGVTVVGVRAGRRHTCLGWPAKLLFKLLRPATLHSLQREKRESASSTSRLFSSVLTGHPDTLLPRKHFSEIEGGKMSCI